VLLIGSFPKNIWPNYCSPPNVCVPFIFATSEIKRLKKTKFKLLLLAFMDAKVAISPKC
jgi:hypothetical protein